MLKAIATLILIYAAPFSSAQDGYDSSAERGIASPGHRPPISELIPDLKEWECQESCTGGANSCAQFKDINSCIDQSESLGCFWTCE